MAGIETPPDLRPRRLLPLWAPLALTFLLVSGSVPLVNAAINNLSSPTGVQELAAFGVLMRLFIFLHSPLFVTREIAIKLARDRRGARRALRFCFLAGVVVSVVELILGFTPLGYAFLSRINEDPEIARLAHNALPAVAPVPVLIGVRGYLQAIQIRVDDTLFVGLGTLVRLALVALFGLVLGPSLGVSGTLLGALCLVLGLAVETVVSFLRARKVRQPPREDPSSAPVLDPVRFGVPLMFANLLSVAPQLLYMKIAGKVADASVAASTAAFHEVATLQWLFTSATMGMQAITTAKVHRPEHGRAMMRFALMVGGSLAFLLALVAYTPLGGWLHREVILQHDAAVLDLAATTLLFVAPFPLLQAIRFTMRGILISRGRSAPITRAMITSLVLVLLVSEFRIFPSATNGALNAYVWWTIALGVEMVILAVAVVRGGRPEAGLPPPVRTPQESAGG